MEEENNDERCCRVDAATPVIAPRRTACSLPPPLAAHIVLSLLRFPPPAQATLLSATMSPQSEYNNDDLRRRGIDLDKLWSARTLAVALCWRPAVDRRMCHYRRRSPVRVSALHCPMRLLPQARAERISNARGAAHTAVCCNEQERILCICKSWAMS